MAVTRLGGAWTLLRPTGHIRPVAPVAAAELTARFHERCASLRLWNLAQARLARLRKGLHAVTTASILRNEDERITFLVWFRIFHIHWNLLGRVGRGGLLHKFLTLVGVLAYIADIYLLLRSLFADRRQIDWLLLLLLGILVLLWFRLILRLHFCYFIYVFLTIAATFAISIFLNIYQSTKDNFNDKKLSTIELFYDFNFLIHLNKF